MDYFHVREVFFCVLLVNFLYFACQITPRVIAIQENDIYTVELQATSSPDWPFGSQDGRIVLKENSKIKSKINFVLSNDGKGMREGNWTVEWDSDKVAVTIMGEEQKDEKYFLYYNGETKSVNSDLCE